MLYTNDFHNFNNKNSLFWICNKIYYKEINYYDMNYNAMCFIKLPTKNLKFMTYLAIFIMYMRCMKIASSSNVKYVRRIVGGQFRYYLD